MVNVGSLERRVGLRQIVGEHVETWSMAVGPQRTHDRWASGLWYLAAPAVATLPFLRWHLELLGVSQILSGVAVFTALLFGLLVLIFNTGVTLRKDGHLFGNAHDLKGVVSDLRANVTYALVIALLLDVVLITGAAVTDPTMGLAWGWTPAIVWLFLHLGLTLFTILRRLRTAFNYITR